MIEHVLLIAITLATACFDDSRPTGDDELPDTCGGLVCTDMDLACASYPYDQLPAGCDLICYTGRCCERDEHGKYQVVIVDCDRPHADAGVDAP